LQPRYSESNSILTSCLKVHVLSARPHVAISIKAICPIGRTLNLRKPEHALTSDSLQEIFTARASTTWTAGRGGVALDVTSTLRRLKYFIYYPKLTPLASSEIALWPAICRCGWQLPCYGTSEMEDSASCQHGG